MTESSPRPTYDLATIKELVGTGQYRVTGEALSCLGELGFDRTELHRGHRVVQEEVRTVQTPFENCPICGGRVESRSAERELHVGKRSVTLSVIAPTCVACGEYFLSPDELDEVQQRAAELIRKEDGLLFPQQIVRIREKFGLSQARFEQLLGVGPKTVVRWERGTVFQNSATDNLLRVLDALPDAAAFLASRQGVQLTSRAGERVDAAHEGEARHFAYSERKVPAQLVRRVSGPEGVRYVAAPDEPGEPEPHRTFVA